MLTANTTGIAHLPRVRQTFHLKFLRGILNPNQFK